ncbi:MAG: peptidase M14 [Flavobacteriaceae bacterium]|nr:peptidase M14 [Flavobacteriaceae bacterium]
MSKQLISFILFCTWAIVPAQEFTAELYGTYDQFKEPSLNKRRIKYAQLQPLVSSYKKNPKFKVNKVGESIEGRDLHLISIGNGKEPIFLWSQMHGDEPTATMAIFDILNFFNDEGFETEKAAILSKLSLHFLPMLNPDGAERYQRRNALGIDINRDALRLQSPEGRTLKKVRDSLNASFGFNLHDQSTYYNAERTEKPATISYLATAYNYEKEINEVRAKAMQVIVFMNEIIQGYAPGQVGRYSDDFEPRAFGDNIAKWGTSLILIESGGFQNDIEKQEIRKLNYVSILAALSTIAEGSYRDIALEAYSKIPRNDRKLFDLKISNATYVLRDHAYTIDLGIYRNEIDHSDHDGFYYSSRVIDQGDLSTFYGYQTFDASGYTIVPPKVSKTIWDGTALNAEELLSNGIAYLRSDRFPETAFTELPIHLVGKRFELPPFQLQPGVNPTFFLEKEGRLTHAVINGFVLDLSLPLKDQGFGNGLNLR